MKKFLLSTALVAAGAIVASAANFEVYVGTETGENNTVANYVKVTEGAEFTCEGVHLTSEPQEMGNLWFAGAECAAFVKITNLTDAEQSYTINKEMVYNNDAITTSFGNPVGSLQTCIGSCNDTPFDVKVPANASTSGTPGDHLGYTFTFSSKDQYDDLKLDSKYKFSVTNGGETLNFYVTYSRQPNSVNAVEFDENAPKEYFNLQGVRIAEPEAGNLYIVKQGNKVAKQIVR